MANGESTPATSEVRPTPEEKLEELRRKIRVARPEEVGEFLRQYVNLYRQSHPEIQPKSSDELTNFADEIIDSLGFSMPGITDSDGRLNTINQLEALETGKENPSTDPPEPQKAADPIMMFSGQFVHENEDIRINGAGMDFVFKRT